MKQKDSPGGSSATDAIRDKIERITSTRENRLAISIILFALCLICYGVFYYLNYG